MASLTPVSGASGLGSSPVTTTPKTPTPASPPPQIAKNPATQTSGARSCTTYYDDAGKPNRYEATVFPNATPGLKSFHLPDSMSATQMPGKRFEFEPLTASAISPLAYVDAQPPPMRAVHQLFKSAFELCKTE